MMKSFGFLCTAPATPTNIGTMISTFNPLAGAAGACPFAPEMVNVSGNTVPGTADESYSLSLNKEFPGKNGVTTTRLTYRYQSEREGNVFNQATAKAPEQKFFDASVKYTPNDGKTLPMTSILEFGLHLQLFKVVLDLEHILIQEQ
jgi:outer membrane receptor protein involved in Fe transport